LSDKERSGSASLGRRNQEVRDRQLAADRIPDGDPRNAQAIADQIDKPPRKQNVNEWLAPRTQSRTTGELDRSSLETGQSVPRVRIHPAPPLSLRCEAFSAEVRKLRAGSGDAHGPSAPESADMARRTPSLRLSLCGQVIRCRCLVLANAGSGQEPPISRARCEGHLELLMGEGRWPEHRLLKRRHAS
jgi:hypothetical protein